MATYYVNSVTGDDAHGGLSAGDAFETLGRAVTVMTAGVENIVYIADGTYSAFTASKAGASASAPTRFIASGSEAVVSGGVTVPTAGGTASIIAGANYLYFEGIEGSGFGNYGICAYDRTGISVVGGLFHDVSGAVTEPGAGVWIRGGSGHLIDECTMYRLNTGGAHLLITSDSTVSNCTIHELSEDGIALSGSNLTVENNTIYDLYDMTHHSDGIVVQVPDSTGLDSSDIIIRNNTLHDVSQCIYITGVGTGGTCDGIEVYGNTIYQTYWTLPATDWTGVHDNHFDGTVFYQKGLFCDRSETNPNSISNVTFHHNTCFGMFMPAGLQARPANGYSYSNIVFRDNIFSSSIGCSDFQESGATCDNNLYYRASGNIIKWLGTFYSSLATFRTARSQEANGIQADPLFVDAANANFRLTEESPAIGAASDDSDLGAYQYKEKINPPFVIPHKGPKMKVI